jgi:hypothetical protein
MIVDARQAAEAVGVQFIPIVNYPSAWTIRLCLKLGRGWAISGSLAAA